MNKQYNFLDLSAGLTRPGCPHSVAWVSLTKTEQLVSLHAQIDLLKKRILRVKKTLWDMDKFEKDHRNACTTYKPQYIQENRPKLEAEYRKLNIEKIQLVYLAGMMEYS